MGEGSPTYWSLLGNRAWHMPPKLVVIPGSGAPRQVSRTLSLPIDILGQGLVNLLGHHRGPRWGFVRVFVTFGHHWDLASRGWAGIGTSHLAMVTHWDLASRGWAGIGTSHLGFGQALGPRIWGWGRYWDLASDLSKNH